MRKYLLFPLIQLPLILIGQPIQMFTDPTAKWYVADTYPNGSPEAPGFVETMTSIYFYDGDTVIGGMTWNVFYSREGPDGSVPAELEGWVKMENGKIELLDTAGMLHTLYDQNVQVGDSIPYHLYDPDTTYLHVSMIDTLTIAGNEHRVVHFAQPFIPMDVLVERWIEGIGSIHGPLFPAKPRGFSTELPGDSLLLTCFKLADTLYWQHPDYDECETNIIQSLEEFSDDPDLNVWPNPGSDQVNIAWAGSKNSPVRIEMYSVLGELLRAETVITGPIVIATDDLPAGCYSIHLTGKGRRSTMKWIKE